MRRPQLTVPRILAWADRHYELTGQLPDTTSGRVRETAGEHWKNIDQALRSGHRGLRPGGSLARLLAKHRGKRNRKDLPKYTVRQILEWVDAHYARHESWPTNASGPIDGADGETWMAVDMALRKGLRGMPGGSSLARLLAKKRGVLNLMQQSRLTVEQILAWADDWRRRNGNWPTSESGPVAPGSQETWRKIDHALKNGYRGLRGGQSLAKLLAKHRKVTRHVRKRPFSIPEILRWADSHRQRTGQWPTNTSGPIAESPNDTWLQVAIALHEGKRGLAGGMTLARLLAAQRGRRNIQNLPKLTKTQILRWADDHYAIHGKWPTVSSGPIEGAPGETSAGVNHALHKGSRGLPGGSSLAKLLAAERGVPHKFEQPSLTIKQILAWADDVHRRTGKWPTVKGGPVAPSATKTWSQIDDALRQGYRGLPGGQSLFQVLVDHGRVTRPI